VSDTLAGSLGRFYEALELSPEQRTSFLANVAQMIQLQREVEDLLSAHEASENILNTPPWLSDQDIEVGPQVGDEIDSFRLLTNLAKAALELFSKLSSFIQLNAMFEAHQGRNGQP
jgi:hypothetical protein